MIGFGGFRAPPPPPMSEGEIYDQIFKLVEDCHQNWYSWGQPERAYTARAVHEATGKIKDAAMYQRAMSKVYSHQRLYTEILKYLGKDV